MAENDSQFRFPDPFTAFWSDFMQRAASVGFTPPPQAEFVEQVRKAFFAALSEHLDQFLRSDAYLKTMKQAMDHSLAWQQTMNDYLQRGLQTAQMPSRQDSDHLVTLIRGLEERVLRRLDDVERRIGQVEASGRKTTKQSS